MQIAGQITSEPKHLIFKLCKVLAKASWLNK